MFYILKPVNMKRRKRRKIYPKKIEGLPCFSLDLPIIKGLPDWSGIVSNEQLLLPMDITTPPKINSYGSGEWHMKISGIIAEKTLKKSQQDLIFYDQLGKYVNYFIALAPKARKCTVFTSNKRIYENCSNSLYKNYGCIVRVNSMLGIKKGVAITENDNEIALPDFKYLTPKIISNCAIKVPDNIINKLPIVAKKSDLAEALCVGCGMGTPEDYIKTSFYP